MTLRITKEEYKLLLTMLQESLGIIALNKTYEIDIPEYYNTSLYFTLFDKLIGFGEEQNVTEEELNVIFKKQTFIKLAEKIQNKSVKKEEIIKNFLDIYMEDERIFKQILKYAKQVEEKNEQQKENWNLKRKGYCNNAMPYSFMK